MRIPHLALVRSPETFGRHGRTVGKVSRRDRARGTYPVDNQIELFFQHRLHPPPTDIAAIFLDAINRIRKFHVVGGHCFSDGACRRPGFEKLACNFLARADLDYGAVFLFIEIDSERLFDRAAVADVFVHFSACFWRFKISRAEMSANF